MVQTQTRRLKMHENLLFETIKRQAGTLQKAYLEGCMNAVEAGASQVITGLIKNPENIDQMVLFINDNGRGIQNLKEVEEYFETFGQPHDSSIENVIWKQFRMGRGQLFAFGRNVWRTSTYRFTVDIKEWGLDWQLETDLEPIQGCLISVYLYENPLKWESMDRFMASCQKQVRYFENEILFNGKMINTPPSSIKWEYEDDHCCAMFDKQSSLLDLTFYNLGAYVMDKANSKFGVGGVVISKKKMDVNFARNDILSSCPVYQRIQETILKHRKKQRRNVSARRSLTDAERIVALDDLSTGLENYEEIKNLRLVRTAQGKFVSLEDLRKSRLPWSFAPQGNRRADKLMEAHRAIFLDESIKSELNFSGKDKDFLFYITGSHAKFKSTISKFASFSVIAGELNDSYVIIPWENLTMTEKNLCRTLENCNGVDRRICIGFSDSANAWTDGRTYICFNREWLDGLSWSWSRNTYKLFHVLCHELAHDENTCGTHTHGPEFYEKYYEIMNGGDCPMADLPDFYGKRKDASDNAKRIKEKEQHERAELRLKKKLGFVSETNDVAAAS